MEQNKNEMKKQANELIEQAYNRGYKTGYDKAFATLNENWQLVTSEAEEKGKNEAWETAKKIYLNYPHKNVVAIFATYSASETIEKLKEYEEQKQEEDEEIHVGDEVIYKNDRLDGKLIGIVTYIPKTKYYFNILWSDGSTSKGKNKSDFKKTGRTFPEIVELLKKMREDKDD